MEEYANPEAHKLSSRFSEALISPKRLHFSESQSSVDQSEIVEMEEAPNNLEVKLRKAFLSMLGRRARLHFEMLEAIRKVEQLN